MILVEKQFAPMILKLDTIEDLNFLKQVLRLALENQRKPWNWGHISQKEKDLSFNIHNLLKTLQ